MSDDTKLIPELEEPATELEEPATEPEQSAAVETQAEVNADVETEDADDADQPAPEKPPVEDPPHDQAFRLTVYWHRAKGAYGVRCDELGDLRTFAASRGEAFEQGLDSLEDRIAELVVRGEQLPRPYDLDGVEEYSGKLELKISRGLHRDLAHAARRDRVSLDRLVGELLAAGVEQRRHEGRPPPRGSGRDRDRDRDRDRGRDRDRPRGRRGMSQDRYNQVMEDKAAFMEYVRGLDGETGGGGGGGGRGRPRSRGRGR